MITILSNSSNCRGKRTDNDKMHGISELSHGNNFRTTTTLPLAWLSQNRWSLNANTANLRMTRRNLRKFVTFVDSWHSRSKIADLSSNNEKAIYRWSHR